jgi:peptidoglycan/xylan/chitin deacetylase (PgdA/CDA1 family)
LRKVLPLILGLLVFVAVSSTVVTLNKPTMKPAKPFAVTRTPTHILIPVATDPATALPPSPVPTATWVQQGLGETVVPILLYHRIAISPINSPYYISPDKFEAELKLLHDWEYTTITLGVLVRAITENAPLPPRPILITFDDGNLDNYTTAFPIMKKYGFTGILYISGRYVDTQGYLSVNQIQEMARAHWEVGSHGMTHPDLTAPGPQQLDYEIVESRAFLEKKLELPILSFAYPFGDWNHATYRKVAKAGYITGMGIGSTSEQHERILFALNRLDIHGTYDLEQFSALLPWQGD